MSGAVGSRPSLTRNRSPLSMRDCRCSSTWISTARSRRSSKNDEVKTGSAYWAAAEVLVRVEGKRRLKHRNDRTAHRLDDRHHELRVPDRVMDVGLGPGQLAAAARA